MKSMYRYRYQKSQTLAMKGQTTKTRKCGCPIIGCMPYLYDGAFGTMRCEPSEYCTDMCDIVLWLVYF